MQGAVGSFALLALLVVSCSRTGVELDALGDGSDAVVRGGSGSLGDDSETGGVGALGATGGAQATGGIGGTSGSSPGGSGPGSGGGTAGSAGQGEPPIDPGGPIPDCSNDSPVFTPKRERRWLSLEVTGSEDEVARFIVELTPDGPENLTRVSDFDQEMSFDGWSADGRYFALSRAPGGSVPFTQIFDLSHGAPPVPIEVAEPNGLLSWSPTDARYFVVKLSMPGSRSLLSIGDATTGAEQSVEVRASSDSTDWSPDGRYISITGESGVSLIDTLRLSLVVDDVYRSPAGSPRWSPDGHYLAFISGGGPYVYDTETATVDPIDRPAVDLTWYRNDWLAFTAVESGLRTGLPGSWP